MTENMLTWSGIGELSDDTIVTGNCWTRQEVASENNGSGGKGKEGEVPLSHFAKDGWVKRRPHPPAALLENNDNDGIQTQEQS